MESQNLTQLSVKTFADKDSLSIKITLPISEGAYKYDDIIRKTGEALGLKKESLSHFALFDGHSHPRKRYKKGDIIPSDIQDLSFQKWCFDVKQEKDLMHKDPEATNLIFYQALHDVKIGKIEPSSQELQKLEDCLDPEFPADGQYIKLCQGLSGYHCVSVSGCTVCEINSDTEGSPLFPPLSTVDVKLSQSHICFISDDTTQKFTWYDLIKWCINSTKKTIVFTLRDPDLSVRSLALSTQQVDYLFSGVLEMLNILQKQDKDASATFHTDMVTTHKDGSVEWTNGFYDPVKAHRLRDVL